MAPETNASCEGIGLAEKTISVTSVISPISACAVPNEITMPAANAPAARIAGIANVLPAKPPANTAIAQKTEAASIRLARRIYGSVPSPTATLSAPMPATRPSGAWPRAAATITGSTIPTVCRSPIHGRTFPQSN